jgi:hypothetical protein
MREKMEDKKEYTPEEYIEAYKKLCLEYGYELKPEIGSKQQIDGTFTLAVRFAIIKLQLQTS